MQKLWHVATTANYLRILCISFVGHRSEKKWKTSLEKHIALLGLFVFKGPGGRSRRPVPEVSESPDIIMSANHTSLMITWLRDQNIQEGSVRGRKIFALCLFTSVISISFNFPLSFSSRKEAQDMGRIFLHHPGGARLYSCANCDTALTNRSQLTSMVS